VTGIAAVIFLRPIVRAHSVVLGALLIGLSAATAAADIGLSGGTWFRTIGAPQLEAGAGTDFVSPVDADVMIATLAITNTGGAAWSVRVARTGSESDWPAGVMVAVRRRGGLDENGLVDGTSYRPLTSDLQTLFSGSGDYPNIQILLRLDGVSVHTVPGPYNLAIRYDIETSG
jgi:hypothetical protein